MITSAKPINPAVEKVKTKQTPTISILVNSRDKLPNFRILVKLESK